MALRAVIDHPKFAALKMRLGLTKGAALGYLEAVWHFCGRFTPHGDIGKYSDKEIESWVEWDGEPGALVSALIECRWLDRDSQYRLLVHDWAKHADNATKLAVQRSKLPFVTPSSPQCLHSVSTPSAQGSDYQGQGQGQESGAGPEPEARDAHSNGKPAIPDDDGGLWEIFQVVPGYARGSEPAQRRSLSELARDFAWVPPERLTELAKACRDHYSVKKPYGHESTAGHSAAKDFRDWLRREGDSLKGEPDRAPSSMHTEARAILEAMDAQAG